MEARPEGLGEDEEAGEADGVGGVAEEQSGAIAGIGGGGVGGGGHVAVEEAGDLSGGSKSARSKRQNKKEKVVDLCTMLTQCAQAVASYDQRNAVELLQQIRQHSSPYGDATQRLAHYFADGLERRITLTEGLHLELQ
ncbi:hypothetical protein ACLB2K_006670 [Fragaria x ananassa]